MKIHEHLIKMDDLGVPHNRKPPYDHMVSFFFVGSHLHLSRVEERHQEGYNWLHLRQAAGAWSQLRNFQRVILKFLDWIMMSISVGLLVVLSMISIIGNWGPGETCTRCSFLLFSFSTGGRRWWRIRRWVSRFQTVASPSQLFQEWKVHPESEVLRFAISIVIIR